MSSFIVTARGAEYHLSGAFGLDNSIDLQDIAHALAQINRYTGHASRPYSVAEHSLLCAEIAERLQLNPWARMAALMHDAHEAYTGDTSSPAKWAIGQAWRDFEDVHSRAVRRFFGLHMKFATYRKQVHMCDLIALATERRDLIAWNKETSSPWPVIDHPGEDIPTADWVDLNSAQRKQRDWSEWRDLLLQKFHELKRESADWFEANVKAADL